MNPAPHTDPDDDEEDDTVDRPDEGDPVATEWDLDLAALEAVAVREAISQANADPAVVDPPTWAARYEAHLKSARRDLMLED